MRTRPSCHFSFLAQKKVGVDDLLALPVCVITTEPLSLIVFFCSIPTYMLIRAGRRCAGALRGRRWNGGGAASSLSTTTLDAHFTPTPEHGALRDMLRDFVAAEVELQAAEYNKTGELCCVVSDCVSQGF